MDVRSPLNQPLPDAAGPAIKIVARLRAAGHTALLAGGCVRDLLLGAAPTDFDVATDAPPQLVMELFRVTRHVGAQFGVVLVRSGGRWIEVATFRTDGDYRDGRRPESVEFTDAEHDAERRDFTVNGMFLDPTASEVIDYVGGRADLAAGVIRAIGAPVRRFAEDYLRLLRAVRFAARLGFVIEPDTAAALRSAAPRLAVVAPERVREELERMLSHPSRGRAVQLLAETGLLAYLWPQTDWSAEKRTAALGLVERLPAETNFAGAFAALVHAEPPAELERIMRALAFSNEDRTAVLWICAHQADFDDLDALSLAEFKRRLAHPAFAGLRALAAARYALTPDGATRAQRLTVRISAIPAAAVAPPPFVTGEDLLRRGVPAGPLIGEVLDALYTAQLDERITDRNAALAELDRLLVGRSCR